MYSHNLIIPHYCESTCLVICLTESCRLLIHSIERVQSVMAFYCLVAVLYCYVAGFFAFYLNVKCVVGYVKCHVVKCDVAAVVNGHSVVGCLYLKVTESESVSVVHRSYYAVSPYISVFDKYV